MDTRKIDNLHITRLRSEVCLEDYIFFLWMYSRLFEHKAGLPASHKYYLGTVPTYAAQRNTKSDPRKSNVKSETPAVIIVLDHFSIIKIKVLIKNSHDPREWSAPSAYCSRVDHYLWVCLIGPGSITGGIRLKTFKRFNGCNLVQVNIIIAATALYMVPIYFLEYSNNKERRMNFR